MYIPTTIPLQGEREPRRELVNAKGFEPQLFTTYSHPLQDNLCLRSLVVLVIPLRYFAKVKAPRNSPLWLTFGGYVLRAVHDDSGL
jgi:hypothetical protein